MCGLTIKMCHRKQTNKSKLALYKPLLHFHNHSKQLHISNKMERFGYKGGCGIHGRKRIGIFKITAGLGYR